ncbi:MAG: GNAT family N-acetyltransferase, partial [Bacteroidia bacterium]|nr:GNAT family N-acetyltransferase [Bacteroidia bacterium]
MIVIRKGKTEDISYALELVKELATYERAPNEVEVTMDEMKNNFVNKVFDFFVAEKDHVIIGVAIYYYKYSTWKGKCIYLDDIIVTENYRQHGIGKMLMRAVINQAKEDK